MRLSRVFELLLIFLFIAFAASRHVGKKGDVKKTGVRQGVPQRYCTCNNLMCNCCRDFSLPVLSIKGPGCAAITYQNGDAMRLTMTFGNRVLRNITLKGTKPRPVCMSLPGGISKFCGRIYGIERDGDQQFRACLALELRALEDVEAALRVSCFKFGPQGVKLEPGRPVPIATSEEDEDDDDYDDDDDDDFDLDDDDEDDSAENDVDSTDYEGFSVLGDDFLEGFFGGSSSDKKKQKKPKPSSGTRPLTDPVRTTAAPPKKKIPSIAPTGKPSTAAPVTQLSAIKTTASTKPVEITTQPPNTLAPTPELRPTTFTAQGTRPTTEKTLAPIQPFKQTTLPQKSEEVIPTAEDDPSAYPNDKIKPVELAQEDDKEEDVDQETHVTEEETTKKEKDKVEGNHEQSLLVGETTKQEEDKVGGNQEEPVLVGEATKEDEDKVEGIQQEPSFVGEMTAEEEDMVEENQEEPVLVGEATKEEEDKMEGNQEVPVLVGEATKEEEDKMEGNQEEPVLVGEATKDEEDKMEGNQEEPVLVGETTKEEEEEKEEGDTVEGSADGKPETERVSGRAEWDSAFDRFPGLRELVAAPRFIPLPPLPYRTSRQHKRMRLPPVPFIYH